MGAAEPVLSEQIIWKITPFNHLSVKELYAILHLRSNVFVVEQNCVFLEPDGKIDFLSFHLCGYIQDELVAYCRIVPAGVCYEVPSIGRVCVSLSHRKFNFGKILMKKAIDYLQNLWPVEQSIKIGAQFYLQKFYKDLGFINQGEIYMEDGIEHIYMIYLIKKKNNYL